MKHRSDFPRRVIEWPDQRITMPDGVELSVRIWLPEDAETNPVPAILEHLPYRKRDGTIARDELTHPYFAGHGYACIRVDMRGNGDSSGLMEDEYTLTEWQDAVNVMDWVRDQPWSTGDWGMMGISWGGFNALQVAALRPRGMKAVVTLCSTVDRYADDIHYKGGCMLGENLGWASQMLAYSSRPPDPDVVGARWRDMWFERLAAQPFLLETWLSHQRRDAYWKHGSVCEDFDAIEAAVLTIGGWHDGYRNTPAALVRNLTAPVKAIVGPWIHKYPHFAGPEPRIGFLQEALRWWDRWLKGIETGVEDDPSQRLWLMDSVPPKRWLDERPGRWIAVENSVPIQVFPFGDGNLGEQSTFSTDVASPQNCGAGAGEYFPFTFDEDFPGDQSEDDAMSACFDSETLDKTVDIVGAPEVTLRLTPDSKSGQIAVRLVDLRPDGSATLISHGFLNLRHRASHSDPVDLTPEEEIEVTVALDQCAYRLPAGHRLRVAVTTAYWPFIWPSPDSGRVTLTSGSLALPVRPTAQGDEVTFAPPETAPAWKATTLRAASLTRERDILEDGTSLIKVTTDNGEMRDDTHGLATGSVCVEEWRIHPDDPLSAEGRFDWVETMHRGDWSIETRCHASLWADADTWHGRARIEAFEGEELVFDKDFRFDIPRDGI
ncbi:MAG: CocE/NonD family hydrolase [Boseongicola sp.]|nr:CocE/NonD family hydrolase [Boseongicola sp.]